MMAIAIVAAWLGGYVAGWFFTSADAAKTLRRKHAEWQEIAVMNAETTEAALALARASLGLSEECPSGKVHFIHERGKTGGDAA